jgi:hypothetical protein
VGTDWREIGSPKEKSIVPDPELASITSDNAEALLNLYNKLTDDKERNKFVNILLSRLSRDGVHAPIGYLILLVLFRLGHLSNVLIKAKRDLQKDREYGFSDFLRLLDGLLRFAHPSFTSLDLDEIEKFIEGLEEYSFNIQERISAIRATRLK